MKQKIFFEEIAKHLGKNPPKYKLNNWAIGILWRLEALKAFLVGADPLITKETAKAAKTNFVYDNTKISKTISFEFRSLSQSCERICKQLIPKTI